MSGSKNLLLGFWAGSSLRQLEPFIASLRQIAFAGDVCLVVDGAAAEIVQQLRYHGIIVERSALSAQSRMTAMSSRYFSYLNFLTRRRNDYAKVMLTDPTVTVLQSDPFAVPLPADIVYRAEHHAIGEVQVVHEAVVQAYGEAVAHNIRDCMVSVPDATIGTASGILRYLVAMTRELAGRTTPISALIDAGVHNYIVHMRPLLDAWLDSSGGNPAAPREAVAGKTDVVLAFYQRERDRRWLPYFLDSLACVSPLADIHCVGDFNEEERAVLGRHRCTAHLIQAVELGTAENAAYLYLNQIQERLAADPQRQLGHVLALDNMSAIFPRDPFETKTIGLSVFCEGPLRVGESDYNCDRLRLFTTPDERRLRNPIISCAGMRGSPSVVREFQRRLLTELVGKPELLGIHKVVQGVFNKLCHDGDLGFPVIVHPNGAEAYFDFWPSGMAVDTRHGVRIGGAVPGIVFGGDPGSSLAMKLRVDLGLATHEVLDS